MIETVVLVSPRGFCAGVDRAIKIVEEALELFGRPVFVKHEIVHNKFVVNSLKEKGAVFVEEISEVPENSVTIFSAHGVSPIVREEAIAKKLRTIDATCPLVTKVHLEVTRFAGMGKEIIYIGHKGHPESVGVMGVMPGITILVETIEDVEKIIVKDPSKLVYLTQTTLSIAETKHIIAALRKRFPLIENPPTDDICYATTNRQSAVKELVKQVDLVLVVGSKNSSNSNRLMETARAIGKEAYLIDNVKELKEEWLEGKKSIGITAGASAPEYLVRELVQFFVQKGARLEELKIIEEKMVFSLPKEILDAKIQKA